MLIMTSGLSSASVCALGRDRRVQFSLHRLQTECVSSKFANCQLANQLWPEIGLLERQVDELMGIWAVPCSTVEFLVEIF